MSLPTLDLFAGPGGWDEGIRALDIEAVGVELDAAACETREAAGLLTVQADVATLDPREFEGVELLIGSPPCQAFNMAGKGDGHDDVPAILACAGDLAVGVDTRAAVRAACADPRSLLVVEPLRFALALRPRFVVLEQVPPVLPLWKAFAGVLEYRGGYRTWVGILSAERYGVPQVRQRAFLMASLAGQPHPPRPTHQEYVFGEPAAEQLTIEGTLAPWVSMAEALGWGATGRPFPTLASSRDTGGPDKEKVGGSGARAGLYREQEEGRWEVNTGWAWQEGGTREDAQTFDAAEQPAVTVDGKGRWHVLRTGQNTRGGSDHDYEKELDTPAPTVATKADCWTIGRPATTLSTDPRVMPPGGHLANDGRNNDRMVGRAEDAIRVTLEDAAVLQGFPRDYPFRGNKSKRFQQVGNAVPPPLARAVVAALLQVSPSESGHRLDRQPGADSAALPAGGKS